jgi:hypothetical protein
LIVDETIPGKASLGPNRIWKTSGSPTNQWVFSDRNKPPVQNGIGGIVIRQRTFVDPKIFSVAVQGNGGTYPLIPGDQPVLVTFELNANTPLPGGTPGRDQCGEIQFKDVGKPTCKFVKFKLSCK